jgi:hypothetical protein
MKRDWDCIRAIFSALEDKGDIAGGLRPNQIEGFDAETVSYNMKLLIEAKLIGGTLSQMTAGSIYCVAMSMTWDGHELFDKIRSETIWNKIKAGARERAVPLSFDVVKILAIEALKSLI